MWTFCPNRTLGAVSVTRCEALFPKRAIHLLFRIHEIIEAKSSAVMRSREVTENIKFRDSIKFRCRRKFFQRARRGRASLRVRTKRIRARLKTYARPLKGTLQRQTPRNWTRYLVTLNSAPRTRAHNAAHTKRHALSFLTKHALDFTWVFVRLRN